jgi:hypothetical protein
VWSLLIMVSAVTAAWAAPGRDVCQVKLNPDGEDKVS